MARLTASFLFLLIKSCLLVGIRCAVCITKSQRILFISFSWTDSGLCIFHLVVWQFSLLHNSQWITFLTQSCFCTPCVFAALLYDVIKLHLLFCCVLSIFVLTWFVLMALFWAAIRRDSVSLIRFSFRSHDHVFLCVLSPVCCLKYPYRYIYIFFAS